MIYTFAILAAPIPQIKPAGIRVQAIAYQQVGDLVAAVELGLNVPELKASSEEALIKAVVNHDRLICELFADHTLLPLRFGTAFISEPALENYLIDQQQVLSDRLQRLNGYAEYLFKATVSYPKSLEPLTELKGKDYLLAKRSLYLQQQALRSQQDQEYNYLLSTIQLDCRIKLELATPQSGETVRLYLLATASAIENLREALIQWQINFPYWQIELSDRLPIYHFADKS